MRQDRLAMAAGLFGGVTFGLFWIPLRALEEAGLQGPWAMVVFAGLPFLGALPVMWRNRSDYRNPFSLGVVGGLLTGCAFALYGVSLLYTDVVRVILLFYVMPIWGFLLGWGVLGDRITWYRWLAITLGLLGVVVVLGGEAQIPIPRGFGDWCALLSGVFWAAGCILILIRQDMHWSTHGVNFFLGATLVTLGFAIVLTAQGTVPSPDWSALHHTAAWLLPVTLLLILPVGFAALYAPTKLNPGVAGLLFMTEVGSGAISAAIWADEPMGARVIIGLVLILASGLVEPAWTALRYDESRLDLL